MACDGLCSDSALRDAGVRLLLAYEQLSVPRPPTPWHGDGIDRVFCARIPPPTSTLDEVYAAIGPGEHSSGAADEFAVFVRCCQVWKELRLSKQLEHYSHPLTEQMLQSAGLGSDIIAAAKFLRAAPAPGDFGRAVAQLGPRIPNHMRGPLIDRLDVLCRLRGAVVAGATGKKLAKTTSAGNALEDFMQNDCGNLDIPRSIVQCRTSATLH
eukprot:SAG31_NODE_1729_length_7427_cov_1.746725_2_plen_211_part_00